VSEPSEKWTFEQVDPNTSGSSGKIIDLYRNEGTAERGFLQLDAPPYAATLMAREVIQNSWDAAEELRGQRPEAPPFAIDFQFEDLEGEAKTSFIEALGLGELAEHARTAAPTDDERDKLGLGAGDCLRELDNERPLRICRIVEHGASGMYGPWSGAESRMYLAMLSIGYNEKADGSGGTFGYGKAGLIRASHPRVVLAYTCFLERPDDPGVTRRLLGVTYWGQHKFEGASLNGFVRFGHRLENERAVPFENEVADAVAESLGLDVRDPNVLEQLGTTFLVIDPSVRPVALRVAVERNWWPALIEDRFNVEIVDTDGTRYHCRPRRNAQLASFVEAYDHYAAGTTPTIGRRSSLGTYHPQEGDQLELGTLVLVADPAGWSFPDESAAAPVEDRSLVALVREPRMIVEYHLPGRDISRRIPFVRGVFVAHSDVNIHLSKTEPKAHDKWETRESDDVPFVSTKYAHVITNRVKDHVRALQDELRPPIDTTAAVRLSRLDERLSKLRNQRGTTQPPPPRGERPFAFRVDVRRVERDGDLELVGHVDVSLAADAEEDEVDAQVRFAFALDEDGRRGSLVPMTITPPSRFTALDTEDGRFRGIVRRSPARFELRSEPYRHDWTGELLVEGEVVPLAAVET
jgi:hypothetical protein